MRSTLGRVALCAVVLMWGCGQSAEEKQAELQARVAQKLQAEKAAEAREREAAEAASREAAKMRDLEVRQESSETFAKFKTDRPSMTAVEEADALQVAVARVRVRMSDPPAMQARNVRFNTAHDTVCMEVNYKERGKYLGFRQAYVTPDVIWVEPAADDVSHRVFELNFKRMGCEAAAAPKER